LISETLLRGIVACAGTASSQSCGSGASGAVASSLLTGLFSQSSSTKAKYGALCSAEKVEQGTSLTKDDRNTHQKCMTGKCVVNTLELSDVVSKTGAKIIVNTTMLPEHLNKALQEGASVIVQVPAGQ
jgi:hypothetical protein